MFEPLAPQTHHAPIELAPDTFWIRHVLGTPPEVIYVNSLVLRGAEPVIVDTGAAANRAQFLRDVFSLVEPRDVRWVFLSHDDGDHTGNLREVLEACPQATLVTSWFMAERLSCELHVPPARMRWLNDGDSFDAGNRRLVAVRPPVFDSPTTRGLFDPRTGVYWASDAFAAPIDGPTVDAAELDPAFWRGGLAQFQQLIAPWLELADPARLSAQVERVRALDARVIASSHGPLLSGRRIDEALEVVASLAGEAAGPVPGQEVLEGLLAHAA